MYSKFEFGDCNTYGDYSWNLFDQSHKSRWHQLQRCDKRYGDFYLYRDSEGRTIPNTQLIGALSIAEFCAKNPFPQSVVQDPFVFADQFLSEERAGGKEQLQKNRAALKAAEQRVEKVFTDMKTRVIRMLESRVKR